MKGSYINLIWVIAAVTTFNPVAWYAFFPIDFGFHLKIAYALFTPNIIDCTSHFDPFDGCDNAGAEITTTRPSPRTFGLLIKGINTKHSIKSVIVMFKIMPVLRVRFPPDWYGCMYMIFAGVFNSLSHIAESWLLVHLVILLLEIELWIVICCFRLWWRSIIHARIEALCCH